MNINRIRSEQRMGKINLIIRTLQKSKEKGITIDFDKFVNIICYEQRVAKGTAKEYLEVALSQIEHEISNQFGKKEIIFVEEKNAN